MKKILFIAFIATVLSACGSMKVYNSALKQIELGMTRQEVVSLMGDKYTTSGVTRVQGKEQETLEYKDMYKNHFFFVFVDGHLNKWYKETEGKE
ncbi:lipoprotein [Dysgonomonas sp. HDW5A]|uniref:lipoprotein n=1 Tax=unclassified Dysgonomonas TaxID=2630389 RepID=UPI001407CB36|nr:MULTISPECIES: lipoprotein [unclassified Dysgonomonas]QIK56036.1 lipoprotein [Dysgonomonas sp. HDW5B]QIK61445.1 lipoprotein [Dysgonomonas sp. HDW5A]